MRSAAPAAMAIVRRGIGKAGRNRMRRRAFLIVGAQPRPLTPRAMRSNC